MLVLLWEPGVADMVRFQAQAQELSLETQTQGECRGLKSLLRSLGHPNVGPHTLQLSVSQGIREGRPPSTPPAVLYWLPLTPTNSTCVWGGSLLWFLIRSFPNTVDNALPGKMQFLTPRAHARSSREGEIPGPGMCIQVPTSP